MMNVFKHRITRLVKSALDWSYYPILAEYAVAKFKRRQPGRCGLETAYEFANSFRAGPFFRGGYFSICPMQNRGEILPFLARLQAHSPRRLCEIGTAAGGTLFLFTRVACSDALLVSIDLPGGDFGSGYTRSKSRLLQHFALERQELRLVRDNSHSAQTRAALSEYLRGGLLDFLLIDGDHTYEGVRADFEQYSGFVRSGGLVAFHDIVPGESRFVGGVPRFWAEIKTRYKYEEFVCSWEQGGAGIGLLHLP